MPDGARIGIDWGKARIGVAASNPRTSFAFPVETVQAGRDEITRLAALAEEYAPELIYVGLPLTLAGERAQAAVFVLQRATALAAAVAPIPVRLVDERMSTASASRSLGSAGRRAGRGTRTEGGTVSPGLIDNDSKLDWRKVGYYGRSAFAVLLSLAVLVGGGWFVYSEVKEAYVAWRTEDDYLGEGTDPV